MNNYRLKKERERILFSCAVVGGTVILVFLISFLLGLLGFEDFNEYSGPVKITFGTPEGLDELLENNKLTPPELVEDSTVEPVVDEVLETNKPVEEVIEPETTPDIESNPEIVEPVKPIEPVVPETTTSEPKPLIQKGEENGNSHETTFDSTSSKIGRRAYFPISQFMPLPEIISIGVFNRITGDITGMDEESYNLDLFLRYYEKSVDGSYGLIDSVPFQGRPDLWAILDQAGYDVSNPEYKIKYHLNYVIISFEVNSNSNGLNAISSAEIESSSGYLEIDEAVLYGFKQSTYSNSTDKNVKGRFKYSFK